MGIDISGYSFDGPFANTSSLKNQAGVYAVLCKGTNDYKVIDVGQSTNVRYRIENHDRSDCWSRNCKTSLYCAAYYESCEVARTKIEKAIRDMYNPPCGEV